MYTFGSLAKIYLQNIDFRYLNLDIARIVNFIETLKNNKGQQIINVDWETCEPKPFQHVQHFLSDKKVASFMKDFGAAFETWARIEKNEDILVSVEVVEDGYNVTFESNSEFAINNIGRYKQDFQDAISDKNKLDELKKKADIDDFNELISQIFKILTKQLTYQGKLDTNSLFQLQANPNQLMIQFMQFTQNNHDNSNGIQAPNNQGQIGETISNEPSLEETAKFLDKIKPTKNKFILTCISLVVSSVLGYFINQLPILLGFTDVFKYSVAGFLVLLLALITYLNS